MATDLMTTLRDISFKDSANMDLKRENANIDGDTAMGTMLRYGSEAAKAFNLESLLSTEFAEAHANGDIHIHDFDFYTLTTTCCQIDIKSLFTHGFNTGHGFLREPNSIGTAAAQACIAIQSNQNDQHGGQSIPAFDYGLAPAVARSFIKNLCDVLTVRDHDDGEKVAKLKQTLTNYAFPSGAYNDFHSLLGKDGQAFILGELINICNIWGDYETTRCISLAYTKTDKDTYQAMESLVHNLNTMHSRAGAQVPFSSINYGTDTSAEGRMVIKNILLAEEAGLGNGETPIFPIHIFKVRDGISGKRGDINYDMFQLACKVSAKRLFPNFSFMDAPFNKQYLKGDDPNYEVAYMGCRTRVMGNVYDPSKEQTFGRGNLSFTSINLPRLGLKHRGNVEGFFDELKEKVELVHAQLMERYEVQAHRYVYNYPFLMGQGVWLDSEKLVPNNEVAEVLKHGTLTTGFIGLAECLKALIGKHHGESEEAQEIGLRIVRTMREMSDAKSKATGLNFTVIASPAEGLAGRFVKKDRELYGNIEGVTDRAYYTNSFHVPVYFPIRAAKKIDIEAPYHAFTNGGHISYIEIDGDPTKNVEAFQRIIEYMKIKGIGYGSINHPVDRCPICGYTGIIGNDCPRCHVSEGDELTLEQVEAIRKQYGWK